MGLLLVPLVTVGTIGLASCAASTTPPTTPTCLEIPPFPEIPPCPEVPEPYVYVITSSFGSGPRWEKLLAKDINYVSFYNFGNDPTNNNSPIYKYSIGLSNEYTWSAKVQGPLHEQYRIAYDNWMRVYK